MYKKQTSTLGNHTVITLSNKQSKNSFSFVPTLGACLTDLTFRDTPVLDGYTTAEELHTLYYSKSSLLFPFPNRLRDGQYKWQGKSYQFPINNPETGNAIHGFMEDKAMIVSELQLSEDSAIVTLQYEYHGELDYYPFPFLFKVTYEIANNDCFSVHFSVENKGATNMPAGLGWHPYFKVADTIDEVRLELPPCEKIDIDTRMLPTGKRTAFDDFSKFKTIGNTVLDNGFSLSEKDGKGIAIITGTKGTLFLFPFTGENKFNYLQVFTPPFRTSIALEPMTCTIDAFNNGDGLIDLAVGQVMEASCEVVFMGV